MTQTTLMDTCNKIAWLMRHFSKEDIAERMGYDFNDVNRWRRKGNITDEEYQDLCEFYHEYKKDLETRVSPFSGRKTRG